MNALRTLLLIVVSTVNVIGQSISNTSSVKIGRYKWNVVVMMEQLSQDNASLPTKKTVDSRAGQFFDVLDVKDNFAIISILDYPINSQEAAKYTRAPDPLRPGLPIFYKPHFKISTEHIELYASSFTMIRSSLNFGLLNFPFKYRMSFRNRGDFTGAFNFGAGLGMNFRKRAFRTGTLALITGYSISNISLEKYAVRRNDTDLEKTNNYTGFSFSTGLMYEYEKIQVGVSIGADLLNRMNQERFGWKGQGKPWISVGIGYAIFSKQGKQEATGKENTATTQPAAPAAPGGT